MKKLEEYIVEELSSENRAKINDYIANSKINDFNIDHILQKIDTLNTKERFKDTKVIDYIKLKLFTKLYNSSNNKDINDRVINNIYHFLCKYDKNLTEFVEIIEKAQNEIIGDNKRYKKLKILDDQKFFDIIFDINNNEIVKKHLFVDTPVSYKNLDKIKVKNIYNLLSDDKELVKELASYKWAGIGDFEVFFKIYFYNISNPAIGDILYKASANEAPQVIEFKSNLFALKSNGLKEYAKNASNKFFEPGNKLWDNFINTYVKETKFKDKNILSVLSSEAVFKHINDLFKKYLDDHNNERDELLSLYEEKLNNIFKKRISLDDSKINLFTIAEVNVKNLINNDKEEIDKIKYILSTCDLYNLVSDEAHKKMIIFDNSDDGNYMFVDFSNPDLKSIYKFLKHSFNGFKFNLKSSWWPTETREQGLVSSIQLYKDKQ